MLHNLKDLDLILAFKNEKRLHFILCSNYAEIISHQTGDLLFYSWAKPRFYEEAYVQQWNIKHCFTHFNNSQKSSKSIDLKL